MPDRDTEALVRLAGAVADGKAVDWNSERESASSELRSTIRSLEAVERISTAHRSLHADPNQLLAEPTDSLVTGDRWGPLRIIERLGVGGFGEVFRAHDPTLRRDVALKLLKPRPTSAADREERFITEARRLARVRHPNVLIVHGADRHEGRVGLWTDLLEGKTLEQCLVEQGPFGAREAALVGVDLCSALAAVHAAGLVHRDVKASNVMRVQGGRIVLLDFGSGSDRGRGQSATMAGTPHYMAPELLRGEDSGTAADVYSLGVLLYRLVSGEYPVTGGGLADLREAHGSGRAVPLRDVRPDLPAGFVQLVERALSHDPRDRYASMGEMERHLASFVGSPSESHERTYDRTPWWRRGSTWVAAAAVSVLGIALWISLSGALGAFEVDAALFRAKDATEERLTADATVAPGEYLFLEITGSKAMHVYVLNQDEAGRAFLLYPLPRLDKQNPLRGGVRHRLPGPVSGEPNYWQVDQSGGDEWILVAAGRNPIPELERQIAGLPMAGAGLGVELGDSEVIATLRGISGLAPRPGDANGSGPLSDISEQFADRTNGSGGVWVWEMKLRGVNESIHPDADLLPPDRLAPQQDEADKQDSTIISPIGEAWLGNRVRERFLSERRLSTDANLAVRVDEIGRKVARISDRPGMLYRFLVVQGEELQAWSFPGGTVGVTDALTDLFTTDGELAFALGHELAHIALRHYIDRYRLLQHAEASGESDSAMFDAVLARYNSDFEMEADRYGALYAVRAGYDFSKAVKALDKLARVPGAVREDATHADYGERIAALQDFQKELHTSVGAFHAGTESLQAGEIARAIGALRVFVTQFPQDASGHVNLGAAYLARVREGNPLDLAEVLPILPEPGVKIRGTYDRLDLQKALDQFQQALEAEPREAHALAGLGLVYVRLGELDLARQYLKQAHDIVPNSPEITLCLGNVHFLCEEFEEAATHYQRAVSLKADWNAARKNLAITYERLGRVDQARSLWEKLTAEDTLRDEALQRLRELDDSAEELADRSVPPR
jgi:predicted Zn-dependent protease